MTKQEVLAYMLRACRKALLAIPDRSKVRYQRAVELVAAYGRGDVVDTKEVEALLPDMLFGIGVATREVYPEGKGAVLQLNEGILCASRLIGDALLYAQKGEASALHSFVNNTTKLVEIVREVLREPIRPHGTRHRVRCPDPQGGVRPCQEAQGHRACERVSRVRSPRPRRTPMGLERRTRPVERHETRKCCGALPLRRVARGACPA